MSSVHGDVVLGLIRKRLEQADDNDERGVAIPSTELHAMFEHLDRQQIDAVWIVWSHAHDPGFDSLSVNAVFSTLSGAENYVLVQEAPSTYEHEVECWPLDEPEAAVGIPNASRRDGAWYVPGHASNRGPFATAGEAFAASPQAGADNHSDQGHET